MAASHRQGGDRLSALPDRALEHILSNLMSVEAVRTSVLSRRWRDVYEAVPVVDLVDTKTGQRCDRFDDIKVCFDYQVASAILCKGPGTPIRALRLTVVDGGDPMDQWIDTAVNSSLEDLDLTHKNKGPSTRSGLYHETNACYYYFTPPQIFRCRALRRLRITNWTLDLPGCLDMASLETLCLTRVTDKGQGGMLPQLLSSCPRLTNLTLEDCPSIDEEIVVTSRCLRSFAMICCNNAAGIKLQTTCLRSLHYTGRLPRSAFIAIADYQGVTAVRIEICENLSGLGPRDVAPIMTLISRCENLTYLDVSLCPSMAYYSSLLASVLRSLPRLRQLGLQGCLPTDHAIRSVAALLLNTHNLEVLSLLPLDHPQDPEPPKEKILLYLSDSESDTEIEDSHVTRAINNGVKCSGRMPDTLWKMYIGCLHHKVRRINIQGYQGLPLEKMLARFLLSRAAALEELSVTLAAGLYPHKNKIATELRSWRLNGRTKVTCK
ncbi:hypothetical protein ACQ4PT_025283 [Festuca glaucescens]